MMYILRSLQQEIIQASKSFKVILLTGPRQVGKTTLLKSIATKDRSYISLDDIDMRLAAKEDPAGFISSLKLPVLIDEVQYVPELFPYIKMSVDAQQQPGLFWLTGSQQFAMMKNVSESLAGRVAIFELQGISLAEEENRIATPEFLPTTEVLQQRQDTCRALTVTEVYQKIWRGSYPQVVTEPTIWQKFYESYITTYIERDVRDYLKIDDLMGFRKFLQFAAARTGQVVNYNSIAKDLGISAPTVKSWFNVLQATGLVIFIQPYFDNLNKRLIKMPKFYFMDTGLCCFLTKWFNDEVLEAGAMAGAMLETYVITEIIKSYANKGRKAPVYYYADKDKRKVDLLLEQAGKLHPIEIKKNVSIRNTNFKGFKFLENLNATIGHGCVLCFRDTMLPFNRDVDIVPVGYV